MNQLQFDENFETRVILGGELEVTLVMSDDLEVAYETLPVEYEKRILEFLSNIKFWLPLAEERILFEFNKEVEMDLLEIYILSEPDDIDLIFGLNFRVKEDMEHGRGMKITKDEYSIIEYGLADVAFS